MDDVFESMQYVCPLIMRVLRGVYRDQGCQARGPTPSELHLAPPLCHSAVPVCPPLAAHGRAAHRAGTRSAGPSPTRCTENALQLTLDLYGVEINARLNATKDRDSHYGVMSSHNPQRVANVAHGASVVPSVYGFFCVLNGPRVPLGSQVGWPALPWDTHPPPPPRRAAAPRSELTSCA